MSRALSLSRLVVRDIIHASLACVLLCTMVSGSSHAQSLPDAVSVRAIAIKALHPSTRSVSVLLVQDSASTAAEDQSLARLLGGRVRYVGSAAVPADSELALRARILKGSPTDAQVQVDFWGQTPKKGSAAPHPYFARYLVTLRKQGTTWVVLRSEEQWAS